MHSARLARLADAGRPAAAAISGSAPASARKRVLFVSSNGVGMGHLTRLLAIARRMPADIDPVFTTMSQAMPIVEQAGFPVEFIPHHIQAPSDADGWNKWFVGQFDQIVDFHAPSAVVFDGGLPYGGLLKSVAPRSDVGLVWVRRAFWRETQDNSESIRRERFFDMVIEPGDVAEEKDKGATVGRRGDVVRVEPISLLDPEELHSRAAAAEALGLDPSRPAVLFQLGSGWNRDVASMVDAVLKELESRPEVQPVIAEWMISTADLDFWPAVKRIRGFPIAKYFNAFDFSISAAGYNTYNEVVSFALPTIFAANDHAMLDDQGARALFAEEQGAALRLPESDMRQLPRLIDAMLDEKTNWFFRANCRRIARENGATAAADAIARLVEGWS